MTGPYRTVTAKGLQPGMVLALPMDRTVTITSVKVGRQYVSFSFDADDGGTGKSRYAIDDVDIVILNPIWGGDDSMVATIASVRNATNRLVDALDELSWTPDSTFERVQMGRVRDAIRKAKALADDADRTLSVDKHNA
jgi:hypothetical protein